MVIGQKSYSANPSDYRLEEEIGHGASATVYRAIYLPSNEVLAIKCLDLDRCNSNLDDIRKEAQTMILINHPNLIKAYCSFVVECNLWVVMPFMAEGSCLHLMKTAYPDGFEESIIRTILKETLKALEYLHGQGHIHRDVKAGNILMDSNGEVKLSDFGVSACMFDNGDRKRNRNTFIGTPCWMAPEVMQPGTGYSFKADIWSFGITALELAHGHAPFSKYPPMKVLLMTIQNAPPGLDYERDRRFSKSFKEMVAMCLTKDQTKRPTAEKRLKHSFFKNAKPPELSMKKLLADLPPLSKRVKDLQLKDAAQLALKKMASAEQEAKSQSEYQRGVSAWNFDMEDLKIQASLVQEDDVLEIKGGDHNSEFSMSNKQVAFGSDPSTRKPVPDSNNVGSDISTAETRCKKGEVLENNLVDSDNQEKTAHSKNGSRAGLPPSDIDKDILQTKTRVQTGKRRQTQSGPLMPGAVLTHSTSERAHNLERCEIENKPVVGKVHQVQRKPSFSGPLMLPNRASANSLSAPIKSSVGLKDSLDEKSKTNLVQVKGRFSVMSQNLAAVKGSALRKSASVGDWASYANQVPNGLSSKETSNRDVSGTDLLTHLQNLFQQTSLQQDLITNILTSLQLDEIVAAPQNGKLPPLPRASENNGSVESTEREHMLHTMVSELQERMTSLKDELTAEKLKCMQLQQQLIDLSASEEDEDREEENP